MGHTKLSPVRVEFMYVFSFSSFPIVGNQLLTQRPQSALLQVHVNPSQCQGVGRPAASSGPK
jgi:hypothetical protein